jgi:cytochrome c553
MTFCGDRFRSFGLLTRIFVAGIITLTISMRPAELWATAPEARSMELFEKHVRPLLVEHCVRCHGPEKTQAGLRLDFREGMRVGGDSGPAVVPAKPAESLLLSALRYEDFEMPPRGKLPDEQIRQVERWIRSGAADPRESPDAEDESRSLPEAIAKGRDYWAFRPIEPPEVPERSEWGVNQIDVFVQSAMQSRGLEPTSDADPASRLRRLHYDLTGLPPSPETVAEFVANPSADAYEHLVDELLNDKAFGETWGRHWLDVVRFAESSGGGRTLMFPDAWRYRDYVIDSFNRDLPYDQFVREQIAGDLLASDDWKDRKRKLVATGFLVLGPTNYELQDKTVLEMDIVDEQLDTMGKAFLGMTIGCARCHDHKFDPIPTSDYYALAGIFKSTQSVIHSNVSKWNTVDEPLAPDALWKWNEHRQVLAKLDKRLSEIDSQIKKLENRAGSLGDRKSIPVDEISGVVVDDVDAQRVGQWVTSESVGGYVGDHYMHDNFENRGQKQITFQADLAKPGRYEVRVSYTPSSNRAARVPVTVHHADGKSLKVIDQRQRPDVDGIFVSLGEFVFADDQPARVVIRNDGTNDGVVVADAVSFVGVDQSNQKKEPTEQQKQAAKQLTDLRSKRKELRAEQKKLQKEQPSRGTIMAVVDEDSPADIPIAVRGMVHQPGETVPRGAISLLENGNFGSIPEGCSGRLELANWIAHAENPLTARVFVNRVWKWLMGTGIVRSVDNFGSTGSRPTHPRLLDHLAAKFVEDGWSTKALVRRIVLSRTYRQSVVADPTNSQADPDNRWLARMNRKPLSAEAIRDTLLSVSGQLDEFDGGRSIKPGTRGEYGYKFESNYRSVYIPVFRNTLPEVFEVFDFADPNIPLGARSESTVASQALWMLNHPFVMECCDRAAEQLMTRQRTTAESIDYVTRHVLGRSPTGQERKAIGRFVDAFGGDPRTAWSMVYQSLFQSIDFRYLN